MSEPYIRLYVSDMMGDPKLHGLNADMRIALIYAWDLAKNGRGDPDELRNAQGHPMSERELREMASVRGQATRKMYSQWEGRGLCKVDEDGLVTFPKLARRQGLDRTNAARQARFREGRNAKVTAEVTGDITAQNQNQNQSKPLAPSKPARQRDLLWDTFVRMLGWSPETKSDRGRWNAALKELRDAGATPDELERRIRIYRRQHTVACTPNAIAANWGRLAVGIGEAESRRPTPPPVSELPPMPERDEQAAERAKALAATIGRVMP